MLYFHIPAFASVSLLSEQELVTQRVVNEPDENCMTDSWPGICYIYTIESTYERGL